MRDYFLEGNSENGINQNNWKELGQYIIIGKSVKESERILTVIRESLGEEKVRTTMDPSRVVNLRSRQVVGSKCQGAELKTTGS